MSKSRESEAVRDMRAAAEACVAEGLKCVAVEREESYLPLIVQRLTKPIEMTLDLGGVQ